jgi:hypothetical protein
MGVDMMFEHEHIREKRAALQDRLKLLRDCANEQTRLRLIRETEADLARLERYASTGINR